MVGPKPSQTGPDHPRHILPEHPENRLNRDYVARRAAMGDDLGSSPQGPGSTAIGFRVLRRLVARWCGARETEFFAAVVSGWRWSPGVPIRVQSAAHGRVMGLPQPELDGPASQRADWEALR
jgi:hypothetical protein